MCASCKKIWTAFHVLWSLVYVCTGAVQIVTGIFFIISLPLIKLTSNIWAGSWNVVVGIGSGMLACFGEQTARRQEMLLYLTISILIANLVNAVMNEWHFYHQPIDDGTTNYTYVSYARLTTSLCAAAVIITSFLDSQLTFCSMQTASNSDKKKKSKGSHEQVSDIEYIIPRPKTNSVPKSSKSNNALNAYAQSWVFDSEAASSSNTESPYLKLDDGVEETNKTPSKYLHNPLMQNGSAGRSATNSETTQVVTNPVVHIEEASDDSTSNGDRKLYYMKSFSRTPSPNVLSASSSQASLVQSISNNAIAAAAAAPPIYECLERLTEPSVYRSRLNTAISQREDGCVSPSAVCVSPRDRSPVSEKVQYASLVMELEQQFIAKKEKFPLPTSPQSTSESLTVSEDKTPSSSRQESSRTDPKSSDAEFSKELEAALQLIQDLESPNTIETPSEPKECRSVGNNVNSTGATHALAVWRHSDASESEKTLSAVGSLAELTSPMTECVPDMHTFKPQSTSSVQPQPPPHQMTTSTPQQQNGKRSSVIVLNSDSQSTSGYSSPTHYLKDVDDSSSTKTLTPTWSNTSSINGSSSDLPNGKGLACSIMNTDTSAIISLFSPTVKTSLEDKQSKRKSITLVTINGIEDIVVQQNVIENNSCSAPGTVDVRNKYKSDDSYTVEHEKSNTIDRSDSKYNRRSSYSGTASHSGSGTMLSGVKSLLRKKKSCGVPKLPPDLEGAIIKSESLAYLSDNELLARHERNREIQRRIEQRVQQQLGQTPSESQC